MYFSCQNNTNLKYPSTSVIEQIEVYLNILEVTWSKFEVCFKYSLVQIYEADAEASAVSMCIRQKVKKEASDEASRLHMHMKTLENGQWRHFICYWLSITDTKDSKEKETRSLKEKKNVGARHL